MPPTIWTIGHSTLPIDDFLTLLRANDIELIADVRRFPGSRRLPQYGMSALESELARHGIAYRWIQSLGGRRRYDDIPTDLAWRHPGFRAYAAHLSTDEFADGLFELLMCAHGLRTSVMCAEALWWRCHRRLIADVLVSIGIPVVHLRKETAEPHRLAEPARLVGGRLSYAER